MEGGERLAAAGRRRHRLLRARRRHARDRPARRRGRVDDLRVRPAGPGADARRELLVLLHLRAPRGADRGPPARGPADGEHHGPRRLRPADAPGDVRGRPAYGPLEERNDVVVFRTPPLEEAVEVAGPIRVRLHASTDGPDTDFTAKLIDEYPASEAFPSGFALNLTDSICRGRYRNYRREPDLLEPGEVYEFELELYPTANVFEPGHRIRLDVSSSNYPRYDVNHNTGGDLYGDREYRTAMNTIHHGAEHPTCVELPVRSG
nr:CocE/NonD family hydrolase [Halorubrum aethiopicum]